MVGKDTSVYYIHRVIRLLDGLWVYPDTDPICNLALLVIPDLMRSLRLEMLDPLQALPTRYSKLVFKKTSIFAIRQCFTGSRQVSHVDLRRQGPRRTTTGRSFIRWELKTHQSSLRREKLAIPPRPLRSQRWRESRKELQWCRTLAPLRYSIQKRRLPCNHR